MTTFDIPTPRVDDDVSVGALSSSAQAHADRGEDREAVFGEQRARLYAIAYRMLGSKADAEDTLQEAYLRWHRTDLQRVQTPQAWLVTTVTRLCIDHLRAARAQREAYVGPWLPEPLVDDAYPPPDQGAERASDLSLAFLVMLERLSPEERAAFLLHDVLDRAYAEIAAMLGKSEAACRQIVHRARERVRRGRPRFAVSKAASANLLARFIAALNADDHETLLALFADDATWTSDGGSKARAARKVIHGRRHVARFARGIWRRYWSRLACTTASINGEPGLVVSDNGRPDSVVAIETNGTRIRAVYVVRNPDKLRGASCVALH